MHSKFTDILKADVIAQYWRGKPVTKICEEYAVSKSTVYAWIRPCSVKEEAEAVGRHVFIQKKRKQSELSVSQFRLFFSFYRVDFLACFQ